MQKKTVYCKECDEPIMNRDQLIVAMDRAEICSYHADCYGKNLKRSKGFLMNDTPINGARYNAFIAFVLLLGVVGIFSGNALRVCLLLGLIGASFRLYSYRVYERHIES